MPPLDTGLHERRKQTQMEDAEYRDAYKQAALEVGQTDRIIRTLDALRAELGMSKAELARRIGRNDASIRRLFTAKRTRPALPLIAAIAGELGAEIKLVGTSTKAKKALKPAATKARTEKLAAREREPVAA